MDEFDTSDPGVAKVRPFQENDEWKVLFHFNVYIFHFPNNNRLNAIAEIKWHSLG